MPAMVSPLKKSRLSRRLPPGAGVSDAELLVDRLGRTVVGERGHAAAGFQESDDAVGQFIPRLLVLLLQAEVDFAVFPDGLDEAPGPVAGLQWRKDLAPVKQAQAGAVDDGLVAQFAFADDQQVHGFPGFQPVRVLVEKLVQLGAADQVALRVEVDVHHVMMTLDHRRELLADRHQQVPFQTAIHEGARAGDGHGFHQRTLTGADGLRLAGAFVFRFTGSWSSHAYRLTHKPVDVVGVFSRGKNTGVNV